MTTPFLERFESQVNVTDAAVGAGGSATQNDGQVVGLADGRYVVVWTDFSRAFNPAGSAVRFRPYDADGLAIGGERSVSVFPDGDQYAAAVTALPNGGFAVAFVDFLGGDNDIYVPRYGADLNILTQNTIDSSANQTFDPSIAAFADGSYVVSYTVGSGADTDIVGRIVSATGMVGAQFDIHNQADNSGFSELATLTNGNFVSVYRDEFNGSATDTDIRFRILTPTGTGVTPSLLVAGADADPFEFAPDVAALRDGGFVVVWTEAGGDGSGDGVRATIYDNSGGLGPRVDFQVNTTTAGHQGSPNVIGLLDGGFLVTWNDNDANVVRTRHFDAAGNPLDPEVTVRAGASPDGPEAARLLDGRYAYAIGDTASGDADVVTSLWNPRGTLPELLDVLWRHDDGTVAIVFEPAPGDIGASFALVPTNWQTRGTGDFDADGDADILWRHDEGLVLTWEIENGQHVANHAIEFASVGWDIVGTGDFDGDGDADILWRHAEGAVVTWEMENGAYVQNHNIEFASIGWTMQGLGDFDADGDSDIIWRHVDGAVTTWEMENGGYIANHNIEFASTGWRIEGTGDFDGDGDSDILWRHTDGGVVTWEMEAGNYVMSHSLPDAATTWQIQGTLDRGHDGDADILWRHDEGQVLTWEMQDGGFVQARASSVVSNGWHIRGTGEFDLV